MSGAPFWCGHGVPVGMACTGCTNLTATRRDGNGKTPGPRRLHTMLFIQRSVHEWANETFPGRPPSAGWMKLFEELGEVIKDPTDALEWADVFIMLFDLAMVYKIDLEPAIFAKMEINRGRAWARTATGVMSHVKDTDHG